MDAARFFMLRYHFFEGNVVRSMTLASGSA